MFDSKKENLFPVINKINKTSGTTTMKSDNKFLKEAYKSSSTTLSGNGALKYTTTGSDFVDQFAKVTNFKEPRKYDNIARDMQILWGQNPQLTLALTFYIRMITRQTQLLNGSRTQTIQRGQGLKHEGIFRMIWLEINHPDTFWKNIEYWIAVGSWKDIIIMLQYDLVWNGWEERVLDWNKFGTLILAGLENPNSSELLKKYLPQIKARSKCTTVESQADTIIGKWLCSLLFNGSNFHNYRSYRKLKSSGTAHQWQQLISQSKFMSINFDTVHGRALSKMVSSKFLKNHNLEDKYTKWLETKPVAKFTGYPYELLGKLVSYSYTKPSLTEYQLNTIDKQFEGLIETAKKGMNTNSSFITVVDTSGSMESQVTGTNTTAYGVAMSLAIYFSKLLKGEFANAWFEFNNVCKLHFFEEGSVSRALLNIKNNTIGGTNFLSVAYKFVEMKSKGIEESEFPIGILCISDGEFNRGSHETNFKQFKQILKQGGFNKSFVENFKIILWDIPNNYYGANTPKFEDFADTPNLLHISGLDGSVVAFILGTENKTSTPTTSEELFLNAMNQEIMLMLEV